MNDTIAQVVVAIRENRRKFEEFSYSLSEEELARPVPDSTWIVKDFATHLATLDTLLDDLLGLVVRGGQIDMSRDSHGAAFDIDAWNDAQVAARRGRPIAELFAEAATNREKLIETLGHLDEEQIGRSMHYIDSKHGAADFPLKAFLVGWAQHDPMHAADMLKALPGRADDAGLKAWLANPFVSGYQAR